MEYRVMKVAELKPFPVRDIRANVVSKLTERIQEGYNPARPLSVVRNNGNYIVADGNHRLKVLQELGIEEVPCLIRDGDPYKVAVECNADEDTYAPMDLFDWLSVLGNLKRQGLKGVEVADKLGWSPQKVSDYSNVLEKISAQVLEMARCCQIGRADKKSALADFTEGWFRDSGLYALCEKYQLRFMEGFIADGCNWKKDKVQRETAKYKLWQDMVDIAKAELVNEGDLDTIVGLVENNSFRTIEQLKAKVRDLNEKAKDKLICGDAIVELEKLADGSIDLVITDPPYGIEYHSNRSQFSEHVTKEGIENDGLVEALELLDKTCEVLSRKTKADSHLYFFAGWRVCPQFRAIIGRYFTIRNVIIWDKGNHGAGDLEYSWGNRYETIIYATKGNRPLRKRKADIVSVPKVDSSRMIHPTQKPVALIKELLEASARPADTVCDPFMGSGSTIKAAKEFGSLNYIGIELDAERFEKAKAFIGGE
jgi:site-specific DNA-methyltransferase (adenine-specific)